MTVRLEILQGIEIRGEPETALFDQEYLCLFTAYGAKGRVSWAVDGVLPHGWRWIVTDDGLEIGGDTLQTGVFSVDLTAMDDAGWQATRTVLFFVELAGVGASLRFARTTLPQGMLGHPWQHTIYIGGEYPPYTITQVTGKPAWMTIAIDGSKINMSGTPTAGSSSTIRIRVNAGVITAQTPNMPLLVAFDPLEITGTYPPAMVGRPYSADLSITGGSGVYSNLRLNSGSLRPGFVLSLVGSSARLHGTPTTAGTSFISVAVDSSDGQTAVSANQLFVTYQNLQITGTLASGRVGQAYSADLAISGGLAPYTNPRVTSGALPPGLSVSIDTTSFYPTLRISGTPTQGGNWTFIVAVDDSLGFDAYHSVTLSIAWPFLALSGTYPAGQLNRSYDSSLSISGGNGVYSNARVTLGSLPPGLSLSLFGSSLRLFGVPTAAGSRTFTVAVDSGDGQTVSRQQTVSITQQYPVLELSGTYASPGILHATYNSSIAITGGNGVYSNARVTSGALPPGLSLSISGSTLRLSGTLTTAGTHSFTVAVNSGDGQTTASVQTVAVYRGLQISGTYSDGPVNAAYTSALSIVGGSPPYTNPRVTSGSLPTGLSLSVNGSALYLSGTPTAVQTRTFTVAVDSFDGQSASSSQTVAITQQYDTLMLSGTYRISARVGESYSSDLTISGGNGVYSNARVTSGSLPPGLSLRISGGNKLQVYGTPATQGEYAFTVAVDSGDGQSAPSGGQSITVHPAGGPPVL